MSDRGKIFLIRPTEPNRGDMMSRYGLLKKIASCRHAPENIIVLSSRSPAELPGPFKVVRPGLLKDLIPRWEQVRLYAKGDEAWWACGHDFQDDSSLLKLPFLIIKFVFLKIMGLRVKIIAQGAGPVSSPFGRWCIRTIMNLVHSASFRDAESLSLVQSIASHYNAKLKLTVDSALYAVSEPLSRPAAKKDSFLLGVNLRRWFHFDRHWMPYEYRVKLGLIKTPPGSDKMNLILDGMAHFLDDKIEQYGIDIRLIPMYPPHVEPWEDDLELSKELKKRMGYREKVEIVANDLSPKELLSVFSGLDAMIGVRLHSTIISTMLGIPSIHLCYSPKGHSFFKRIGQGKYCIPLNRLLDRAEWNNLNLLYESLIKNRTVINEELSRAISGMR